MWWLQDRSPRICYLILFIFFSKKYYLREVEAEHSRASKAPRKPGTSHVQSCPSGSHHSPPASEMLLCLPKQKLQDTAHEWGGNDAQTQRGEGIQRAHCRHVSLGPCPPCQCCSTGRTQLMWEKSGTPRPDSPTSKGRAHLAASFQVPAVSGSPCEEVFCLKLPACSVSARRRSTERC